MKGRAMLEIKGLSCGYGRRIVLRKVSLAIERGEIMGIIGPNGSGKTTLLRAISGLLHPTRGHITLEGREIQHLGRQELAQKIAVVTQSPEAAPPFSVEEFVLLGRVPHWGRFQLLETSTDMDKAEQAMHVTGIASLRGRRMGELSGGEQQLAFLARALAQEPRLLLLDEPTAHLDIGHQGQIMDLLRQLNRGHALTVAVVMHDLALASLYCQRLCILHQGRLRKIGTPRQVLTKGVIEEVYRTKVSVVKALDKGGPIILPLVEKGP